MNVGFRRDADFGAIVSFSLVADNIIDKLFVTFLDI